MKKLIIGTLLIIVILSLSATSTMADPFIIVGDLHATPTKPAPLSTVTFSVTITEGTPTAVYVWYHECKPGLCYSDQNVTMTKKNETTYERQVTFTHSDATYVIAHTIVFNEGKWSTGIKDLNLTLSTQNNNGSNNNNSGNKKTPGFEIVPVLGAIAITLILIRKKRSK